MVLLGLGGQKARGRVRRKGGKQLSGVRSPAADRGEAGKVVVLGRKREGGGPGRPMWAEISAILGGGWASALARWGHW